MPKDTREEGVKKSVRTRSHIVASALELFIEKGFDETTMRDVAAKANLSVGSTYYYFKTKEALVLAFYVESCEAFAHRSAEIVKESKDLSSLLTKVIKERLAQLSPYRSFLGALIRSGLDPKSECSPFSEATAEIRQSAIAVFQDIVQSSGVKVPKGLSPYLSQLLWLYHLGIILFWVYDSSAEQKNTHRLIAGTVRFIVAGLAIARLPLMGSLLKPLIALCEDLLSPARRKSA